MSKNPFGFAFTDDIDLDHQIQVLDRLRRPEGCIDAVLDTDAFNEVDDQFALAYLIQSKNKIHLEAIYAAPFFNHHSTSAQDGMEKSYLEIFKVFELMHLPSDAYPVYKGAPRFLSSETEAVPSDAVEDLIARAKKHTRENPLYVIGIAAATNIASAIIKDPSIIDRIFIVWLGGMSLDWHDNNSFNASGDIAAARVILGSGAPLVLLPGRGVVDHFHTGEAELKHYLEGKNDFCDYLIQKTCEEAALVYGNKVWSRPLSDVTAVAWLVDNAFMLDRLESSPIMTYDRYYSRDPRRHLIRYVYAINRDLLMEDLFQKLAEI